MATWAGQTKPEQALAVEGWKATCNAVRELVEGARNMEAIKTRESDSHVEKDTFGARPTQGVQRRGRHVVDCCGQGRKGGEA